jgi:putative colanic acid biosynthesis acetyltransferase WcaF
MKPEQLSNQRKEVNLGSYNNSWYKPGNAVKIAVWMVVSTLFFNHPMAVFSTFKCFLLRRFGAKVGRNVVIKPSVNIKYPWLLQIGNEVWIGERVWIDNLASVTIGSHVCISQGAMLLTGNHNYNSQLFDLKVSPVILQDGTWIGAKSVVCPGVTVYSHAVLAVSSVATKDLHPYSVYQGNPAIIVKDRLIL